MEKFTFNNGIKLIYEYRPGDLTSFCIGFNAGAMEEDNFPYGTAHAVEHMVFKETKKRKEIEINRLCDEIFGFNNAMTNYPYVIYYGTLLSNDFEKGIELYSDIVINPLLSTNGFNEEINIIKEELKEWKDDIYQFCEDELLANSFNKRRIKYPIIGTEDSINNINLEFIKGFYKKYYTPANCVISVVSSISFDKVYKHINEYFGKWYRNSDRLNETFYEMNNSGIYECSRNIEGAKIQLIYPIHFLKDDDIIALKLFSSIFGEGTSSILYDEVRTKRGLAYDISSSIKNERGIKLFSISAGTSIETVDTVLKVIMENADSIEKLSNNFSEKNILKLYKRMNLKKSLNVEKSIILCNTLATYELMYNSCDKFYDECKVRENINYDKIMKTAINVLKNPSIEIIKP